MGLAFADPRPVAPERVELAQAFANQTRFGERFREVTGTSPAHWRRNQPG